VDCEGHGITLPKWYDLGAALHAWPLLRQDELAACEVDAGLGEKNCDLDRKCDIALPNPRKWRPSHAQIAKD